MTLHCRSTFAQMSLLSGLLAVAFASTAEAVDVTYRGFVLGSSVAAVTGVTRSAATDVTVIHQRPRLIQQLIWQPRFTPGVTLTGDSAREIEFLFLEDRLFSILVRYNGDEIASLTAQDLVAAISKVYGVPAAAGGTFLARWDSPGVTLTLSAASYPAPYHLRLVSTALGAEARLAAAEAERLERLDAPRLASDRAKEDVVRQGREDAWRRDANTTVFRP